MAVETAADDESVEMEEVLAGLSGSGTLELLGMTNDDLQAARSDSELFETLRIVVPRGGAGSNSAPPKKTRFTETS